MFVVFLSFFVLCCFGQTNVVFFPTEYSSLSPFQFDVERNSFAVEMDLCNATIYHGCTMTAVLNLPFTLWSIDDGTFAAFQIAGEGDGCANPVCKNDPNGATRPNSCSFVYRSAMGAKLYASGIAGRSAGFQATFNMQITCPPGHSPTLATPKETPKPSPFVCPVAPGSKRSLKLLEPDVVETSPLTTKAKKYALSVCQAGSNPFAKISFSLQARDQASAFATYFCTNSNCNTNNSPIGWFDNSGTATNLVEISNLQNNLLYFTIYGWGQFQGKNNYVFNIEVQ